jgi:(+)-trans-carveol dehydrogenase
MGRVDGKVAYITGAARGQGRSHAVRLAEEGADIIAVDICSEVEWNIAQPATPDYLAETVHQIKALDRKSWRDTPMSATTVRSRRHWTKASPNSAASTSFVPTKACGPTGSFTNSKKLSGRPQSTSCSPVWHTCKAAVPKLIEQGDGGSIIITRSVVGLKGVPNLAHYTAAKHGVVGLMRTMALELAPRT